MKAYEVQPFQVDEAFLRSVVFGMVDPLVVVDTQARVRFVNTALETLLGRRATEIIGCPVGELVEEEGDLRFFAAIRRVIREGTARDLELDLRSEGGERIPVLFRGAALRGEDGHLRGVVGVFRDMREVRKLIGELERTKASLEEKVLERTAELEAAKTSAEMAYRGLRQTQAQMIHHEKMASLGQLVAGIAHEINNPMGFILSNLSTLQSYAQGTVDLLGAYRRLAERLRQTGGLCAAEDLRRIEAIERGIDLDYLLRDMAQIVDESTEGAQRVKKIVSDLKEFSHAGDAEMKPSDLNRGIQSTLGIVWNELKYKANVVRDLDPIPEILCHPQELNQVFMNLFVNAAQAIEGSGEIRIRTRQVDAEHVAVEVSDTGKGIPEEMLPRIFDPFFTTKGVGKGTGLGLSISYGIIRKHRGRIDVRSEVGKGTTFTVTLPVRPKEQG